MMARPDRLFTRWKTTIRVMITRMIPAVKLDSRGMVSRPMGPPMIISPSSARLVLSLIKLICRPLLSTPT